MATAAVLRDRGLSVAAYDDKPLEQVEAQRADLARLGVEMAGKEGLAAAASGASIAILSPGVPANNPAVLELQRSGLPVISEIEAAYRIARAPIIAITGSKGKSTTTALTGHLLRAAGVSARTGGNMGHPPITQTAAAAAVESAGAGVGTPPGQGINPVPPHGTAPLDLSPAPPPRYPANE